MAGLASVWEWPDVGLSEIYGHDGPGVCLGDEQTEAEGVPLQGGASRSGVCPHTFPDLSQKNKSIFTQNDPQIKVCKT